jgi:hypothetical protein
MVVDPMRLEFVRAFLMHICDPAPEFPEGQVTSCYYDTPQLDEYFTSIDGEVEKNKVRLRWYDALPPDGQVTAFLELKSKHGAESTKQRTPVNVSASLLSAEDFEAALPRDTLVRHLLSFGYQQPSDLRPTVLVTYRRCRFIEPHTQMGLSLDSNISAWLVGEHRHLPATRHQSAVLELKGGSLDLPLRLRAVLRFGTLWTAYSKYTTSIEALAGAPGPFQP